MSMLYAGLLNGKFFIDARVKATHQTICFDPRLQKKPETI